MPQTQIGVVPRYIVPGIATTKTVHMMNTLVQLVADFSQEKNITQREIFEVALIEFFKSTGTKMKWKGFSVNDTFPMKHIHFDECVSFYLQFFWGFRGCRACPNCPCRKLYSSSTSLVVQLLLISTNH